MVSIWISEVAAHQVGLSFANNFLWDRLHHLTADWAIWLVGLHLAFNWKWIANAFSRYLPPFSHLSFIYCQRLSHPRHLHFATEGNLAVALCPSQLVQCQRKFANLEPLGGDCQIPAHVGDLTIPAER